MKNIYVNGCSFSAGHQALENRNGIPWPSLFDNNINVINDSLNGGSSFRALRMCIEAVSQEGNNIDTVICQLSEIHRGEMVLKKDQFESYDNDIYVNYNPRNFVLDYTSNQQDIIEGEGFKLQKDFTYLNDEGQTIEDKYYHKLRIYNDQMLSSSADRDMHILGLCNNLKSLCKAKGIKLLLMAMSEKCIPQYEHITPYFAKPLCNIIGDPELTASGHLVEGNGDDHPNEAGHEEIYKYILSELEQITTEEL